MRLVCRHAILSCGLRSGEHSGYPSFTTVLSRLSFGFLELFLCATDDYPTSLQS
jgi:hypothetical protein